MRNLLQYPIERKEILSALDWAMRKSLEEGRVGDVTPAALQEAKKLVEMAFKL
jgi:hypothetical protein